MADYEQKPNTGSAWKNDYKDNDSKPDFKGKFTDLHGDVKEIALWKKLDKNQNVYLYFAINDEYVKPQDDMWPEKKGEVDKQDYDKPIDLSSIPF